MKRAMAKSVVITYETREQDHLELWDDQKNLYKWFCATGEPLGTSYPSVGAAIHDLVEYCSSRLDMVDLSITSETNETETTL